MKGPLQAGAAVWLLAVWTGLCAAAQPHYELRAEQVAADTYVIVGRSEHFSRQNGGNIVNTAFIVTRDGVVVIDTGPSRAYGEALRQSIARHTDLPVLRVYNTHHHPDHVLGNQAFADVPIAALAASRRAMAAEGPTFNANLYALVGDWMTGTEPVEATETVLPGVVETGGHRLRLMALAGHSGADLVILDESTGVLFASDLVFHGRAATTPHADLGQWLEALEQLRSLDFRVLVPGHGPPHEGIQPILETRDYLRWLGATLNQAAADGVDSAELLYRPIPEPFAALAVQPDEFRRSVAHLYPALERAALPATGTDLP